MIYTKLTKKAMIIAYNAHMNQFDKAGVPYIFHPIHLAEQMDTEAECAAALLHDVAEDTDITLEELAEDFPEEVMDALRLLTRKKGEDYMEYVKRIKVNQIAVKVKIADLKHNSCISRIETVTEKDRERIKKYEEALELLQED